MLNYELQAMRLLITSPFKSETLQALFPPFTLVLVLFPFFAGLIINPGLSDFREVAIEIIWMLSLTIPFSVFGKKILYYICASACFAHGFVSLVHWLLVGSPVTASSLYILFSTNFNESAEFVDLKGSLSLLLLIPYCWIFILALRFAPKVPIARHKILIILGGVLVVVFITENALHGCLVRKGTPLIVRAAISYYEEVKLMTAANVFVNTKNLHASSPDFSQKQLLVLIIGESLNRSHMSLYGYRRETTPHLKQFPGLIVYDNVVSAYPNTINSILLSLTQSNLENQLNFAKSISLIAIYKAAGFKTFWLSNQCPTGVWDNPVTLFAQKAYIRKFVNISSNSSFESTYNISFDQKLFQPALNALEDTCTKKLVIIHLMGNHNSYAKRFPAAFNRFRDEKSDEAKTIADYDNSVLYNDFVVDSLLKQVKFFSDRNQVVSAVVYFSDHGENVYDEYGEVGHDFSENMSRFLVEVPFMVWLSPAYQQVYAEKSGVIRQNMHQPFVTDDLFHACNDLMSIETPSFENKRSVFNKDYNNNRSRILADGKDYDQKKK